ncbi:MAG TPA: ABC transporter ATP-binding protein [Gaiellaceae bacterium]|jgi:ATP-binding cassette subfamily B protein|nr:ABC transporter ATP-binding protein [Gaiellaceae bacterium]
MTQRASTKHVWRSTRSLAREVQTLYLWAALAVIVSTLITLAGPALVGYGVDHGIAKDDLHPLNVAAVALLCLAVVKPFVVRAQTLLAATAGERFLASLRTSAFEKLQVLPLGFFERERTGVLVSRLTSDVQALTEFLREALVEVVGSGLQIVFTIGVLVILSPKLAAVSLVALPVLTLSSWAFHRSAGGVYLAIRDRVAETLTALQEGLSGVRVVQAFRRERRTLEAYEPRSRAQVGAWRRASYVNIRLFTMIPLAQTVALVAVLLVAASMYRDGSISEGTIAAYVLYLVQLFDPIARFSEWLGDFRQGLAALGKLVGLLETENAVAERPGAQELPAEGAVELDDVTFGYDPDAPVVEDVSLRLQTGEQVALVGVTGAGKSTLAKLLTRQYDPQRGSIALGGVDLRDGTLASLRHRIVMLPQEGHLFSGTIADNVRLADPEASDEAVLHALEQIGARERFVSLPAGIHTDVQTRGVRLSAGERQLVGIARVALADPAVIVLDEATSSLDPATEAAVERALAAVVEGRTVIVIAHRLSTAERADRVVVMDGGRVVEVASHEELVAQGERYASLWASWQAGVASGTA